jgi:two-component system CheB/CheR fusion protein
MTAVHAHCGPRAQTGSDRRRPRPISDIKPNIDCAKLEAVISEAIDTMSIMESECRDRNGKLYSLRIRPYRNVENRIDGAVNALFEVQGRNELMPANPDVPPQGHG